MDLRDRLPVITKSLDVSKAIDKAAGAERQVTGRTVTPFKVDAAANRGTSLQGSVNGDFSKQVDEHGYRYTEHTAPATDAARQWSGWGTSLKPAHEPIIVARRPFPGNVASCVLEHGTGGLNIDASRVGTDGEQVQSQRAHRGANFTTELDHAGPRPREYSTQGRWPANVVFTHSPACTESACDVSCPVAELDRQNAGTRSSKPSSSGTVTAGSSIFGIGGQRNGSTYVDSGGASRFFHCFRWEEKAPPNERPMVNGVAWPTVKPLDLMKYLVTLVTPPGGTVLDPFCGTGTTLQAARSCGFTAIGIDEDPDAITLTKARLDARPKTTAPAPDAAPQEAPQDLFDLLGGVS